MNKSKGFTLLELLIGLTIFLGLIALALPSYRTMQQGAMVRSSADSMLAGLYLARSEAVKTNSKVRFFLTTQSDNTCQLGNTAKFWVVSKDSPVNNCAAAPSPTVSPRIIQTGKAADTSANLTVNSTGSQVTFNGSGFVTPNSDGSATISEINLFSSKLSLTEQSTLRVQITSAGRIKMCRPTLSAGDPRACD